MLKYHANLISPFGSSASGKLTQAMHPASSYLRLISKNYWIKTWYRCFKTLITCLANGIKINQAYSFELWTVFLENLGVAETSFETILNAFLSLPIDCLIVGRVAVFGVTGLVFLDVDLMELSFFSNVNVSSRFS